MNRPNEPREPETDPVWDLLAESPPPKAGPVFASKVVRAARLEGTPQAPWRRWLAPRPLAGLAAAAAAITIAFIAWPKGDSPDLVSDPADFEDLQAVAEEELLLAAADNLADFSDAELIALLGF